MRTGGIRGDIIESLKGHRGIKEDVVGSWEMWDHGGRCGIMGNIVGSWGTVWDHGEHCEIMGNIG